VALGWGGAPAVADESDGNDDVDRMDDMVAHIGRGYNLESEDAPPEVQNFYRLLAASEEKVHDGTDMTVLHVVTRLMGFKSKYNYSNQCYNDIVKFVINLIPMNHDMPKEPLSQWITRRLTCAKKLHIVLQGEEG
jgi:hypothetical protein